MSCGFGCGGGPSRYSPEYYRPYKPTNNAGCACSGNDRNSCDRPSLAKEGSPLWEWEQIHGKLITKITYSQDDQGHRIVLIEKTTCPPKVESPSRHGCCSVGYRVNR